MSQIIIPNSITFESKTCAGLMPHIYEYLWLDAENRFRSKIKILFLEETKTEALPPIWNYDGSSTGQAFGRDSDITLVPVRLFKNVLIDHPRAYLVICETYDQNGDPLLNNYRHEALKLFSKYQSELPWYGLEQEYFLINRQTGLPLGFPSKDLGSPAPQGPYYCSSTVNQGRMIAEKHMLACLEGGINLSGINAEVALGQWEFQVGPCEGIEIGDHMMAARFMLEKIADASGCNVDFSVKPLKEDWNGSGCHVNFSTKKMREGDQTGLTGLDYIVSGLKQLAERHQEHLPLYGQGNSERLSGRHETSDPSHFTWGIGDRGASVRIGRETFHQKKGYLEDRRPGSNIDPYLVCAKILASVMGETYPPSKPVTE